jgi:DNA-binding beta-propeller fold protein YncE
LTNGVWTLAGSIQNLGSASSGVVITPDGRKAYVSNAGDSRVAVLNIDQNGIVSDSTIRIFIPNGTPSTPYGVPGVAVTPDGLRLFVAGNGKVSIVDTTTDTVSPTTINISGGRVFGIGMRQ